MKNELITVSLAQQLIVAHAQRGRVVSLPLHKACGVTLAQDVHATLPLPPFDQSNVDGYAIRQEDFLYSRALRVCDESAAGTPSLHHVERGDAVRIFTGAVVPSGADLVVMQEMMSRKGDFVRLKSKVTNAVSNIRPKGSHLAKGEIAVSASSVLQPATIGLLASLGLKTVRVFRQPRVCIIVTGSELQVAGKILASGQVYESNSITIATAIEESGFDSPKVLSSPDDPAKLNKACEKALKIADIVIISGGISVGDYDYVKSTLDTLSVQTIFYKVLQRPGKPLYYGIKESTQIFALPGNPASALTCFYEYVFPSLRLYRGISHPFLRSMSVTMSHGLTKAHPLTWFVRAMTDGKEVKVLEGQESYKMASYAQANCLLVMEANCQQLHTGDTVEVHLLPTFSLNAG